MGQGWFWYLGQAVGQVEGSTFRRKVKPAHQLRQPPAWALWEGLVAALERSGVSFVQLDEAGGTTWLAPLGLFRSKGILIDRGAGRQLALTLPNWARMEIQAARPEDVAAMLASLGGVP
jgi:hypothetical protein